MTCRTVSNVVITLFPAAYGKIVRSFFASARTFRTYASFTNGSDVSVVRGAWAWPDGATSHKHDRHPLLQKTSDGISGGLELYFHFDSSSHFFPPSITRTTYLFYCLIFDRYKTNLYIRRYRNLDHIFAEGYSISQKL